MASQSENSVSLEFRELLELLNALEARDSRPLENFATLARLLVAGKIAPAESSFEDHQFATGGGIPDAEEQTSSDERIAERPSWREDEPSEAEIENRFAVHRSRHAQKHKGLDFVDGTSIWPKVALIARLAASKAFQRRGPGFRDPAHSPQLLFLP
jgi:hypothetical protein